jgi:hypothetical protein
MDRARLKERRDRLEDAKHLLHKEVERIPVRVVVVMTDVINEAIRSIDELAVLHGKADNLLK